MKVGVGIKPKTSAEEAISHMEPVIDLVCTEFRGAAKQWP